MPLKVSGCQLSGELKLSDKRRHSSILSSTSALSSWSMLAFCASSRSRIADTKHLFCSAFASWDTSVSRVRSSTLLEIQLQTDTSSQTGQCRIFDIFSTIISEFFTLSWAYRTQLFGKTRANLEARASWRLSLKRGPAFLHSLGPHCMYVNKQTDILSVELYLYSFSVPKRNSNLFKLGWCDNEAKSISRLGRPPDLFSGPIQAI